MVRLDRLFGLFASFDSFDSPMRPDTITCQLLASVFNNATKGALIRNEVGVGLNGLVTLVFLVI